MRTLVLSLALGLAGCGFSSDPITPMDYAQADAACAPFGGLTSVKVSRSRHAVHMVVQCANGAVIDFMPEIPKTYYHMG